MRQASPAVYDSARRPSPMIEELVEAFRYKDLIKQLVRRDILSRYKRSVLGVAWTMLNPLGMMVVLTLVFSNFFSTARAFPVYLLTGLVAWNFLAQTTTAAMQQLTWGSVLLHRIYLPRTIFALSSVGTGLVNLVLSLVPLAVVMMVVGVQFRLAVLTVPLAIILLALFALGVGLLLSTFAVYFPDVIEMYQVLLLAWLYLTPIIYPELIVPEAYRLWMFRLNPMYYLVKLFRLPLYEGRWPTPDVLAIGTALALGTATLGWIIFSRKADEFAYRI